MALVLDLEKLSLDELKKLLKDVGKAIEGYEQRKRAQALAELEALAAEHGYRLSDLVGGNATKPATKGEPKYRHPEDATLTWTGRGRQPTWIKDGLAAGKSLSDFAI